MISYFCRSRITSIIDGDTVIAETDLGRGIFLLKDRLRLHGINSPEKGYDGYDGAKTYLESIIEVGKTYKIETIKVPEKYGRYRSIIYLDDSLTVNDLMIKSGHAVRYMM